MTISSLIPSVSILVVPAAPGDGGGVFSNAALPLLLGRSANDTFFVDDVVDDRGRAGEMGDVAVDEWDLLTFLAGGGCVSVAMEDFEREGR